MNLKPPPGSDGVEKVTCASAKSSLKISLPSQKEDFIKKTLMLNLTPDINEFEATAGTLFQNYDIVKDVTENKYILAQANVKSQMIEGYTSLDFLAIKGEKCGEYEQPTC